MTLFEQQVAEALAARYWPTEPRSSLTTPPIDVVVAAAIEAALADTTPVAFVEAGKRAALTALRGGT